MIEPHFRIVPSLRLGLITTARYLFVVVSCHYVTYSHLPTRRDNKRRILKVCLVLCRASDTAAIDFAIARQRIEPPAVDTKTRHKASSGRAGGSSGARGVPWCEFTPYGAVKAPSAARTQCCVQARVSNRRPNRFRRVIRINLNSTRNSLL